MARSLFAAALAAAALATLPAPSDARTLSGSYLAAKAAAERNDHREAATRYAQALTRDPSNMGLRDRALTFALLVGDLGAAAAIAAPLAEADPSHRLAALALLAEEMRKGDHDAALARLDADAQDSVNRLVADLIRGWAHVGRGDAEAMEAAFESLAADPVGRVFARYHQGLARAALGDDAAAAEALQAAMDAGGSREGRPALALAGALERLGQVEAARDVYEAALASGRRAPLMEDALAQMQDDAPAPPLVRSAAAGAAETFLSIGGALSDQNALVSLLYARVASALRPELHDARLLIGNVLLERDNPEAAARVFGSVPRRSPLFASAEIGRADALQDLDRIDEAIAALRNVARAEADDLAAQLSLAGALRRAERWEESIDVYDEAVALIEPVENRHWGVFYERGIANERAGRWDDAETDFFKALELRPDQPHVLNYLGYSWVEQRRNFDEAQTMIEKAVEQEPENGYIADSLGWVLYRVGKFEEAVPILERATELEPTDPIINDHLGDAFWMVGRRLEARFQWRRALSFDPEQDEAERIRRKLDVGLDAVLAEEEAAAAAEAVTDDDPAVDDG
ncbi:MAG: tetratricopeptide repeat protein [Pseudomonadota bacterium]